MVAARCATRDARRERDDLGLDELLATQQANDMPISRPAISASRPRGDVRGVTFDALPKHTRLGLCAFAFRIVVGITLGVLSGRARFEAC